MGLDALVSALIAVLYRPRESHIRLAFAWPRARAPCGHGRPLRSGRYSRDLHARSRPGCEHSAFATAVATVLPLHSNRVIDFVTDVELCHRRISRAALPEGAALA